MAHELKKRSDLNATRLPMALLPSLPMSYSELEQRTHIPDKNTTRKRKAWKMHLLQQGKKRLDLDSMYFYRYSLSVCVYKPVYFQITEKSLGHKQAWLSRSQTCANEWGGALGTSAADFLSWHQWGRTPLSAWKCARALTPRKQSLKQLIKGSAGPSCSLFFRWLFKVFLVTS